MKTLRLNNDSKSLKIDTDSGTTEATNKLHVDEAVVVEQAGEVCQLIRYIA